MLHRRWNDQSYTARNFCVVWNAASIPFLQAKVYITCDLIRFGSFSTVLRTTKISNSLYNYLSVAVFCDQTFCPQLLTQQGSELVLKGRVVE